MPTRANPTHAFTIAQKNTKMGFSDHERCLWIDYTKASVSYGKIDKMEPFSSGVAPVAKGTISLSGGCARLVLTKNDSKSKSKVDMRIWEEREGLVGEDWLFMFKNQFVAE